MRVGAFCVPILVQWVSLCLSARILVVVPFPGKSHHIYVTAIMTALAKRGHHVVEYSPYPPKAPIPNHTYVELHTRFEKEVAKWTYEDFVNHPAKHDQYIYGLKVKRIWEMNQEICEDTFSDSKIQQLLNSDSKFDLVLTESTFGEESLLIFGHRFSAPTVSLETFTPWNIPNWVSGNSLSVASVPDVLSKTFEDEIMSFKDRVLNFVSTLLTLVNYHYSHLPYHEKLVKKYFPHPDTPSVSAMVANVSLYLTNSHPQVVNYIQPYTPNIVPVGGIHITPENTSLPLDIQSFLDNAKEGFIFFSLGSVVPTHLFPKEILQTFINVFRKLPQNVLWKIDLEIINNIPKNVKIIKWAPQIAVLEHPNCRLFITHGGLFSHHEGIYAGVPTVGIPFFSDQPYNLQYNVVRGRGIKLDFATLDENKLYSAITTALTDSRYMESARRLSRIYRDQPMSPLDSAVFWVEYVLRHGGAHHLKPASIHLSWYQLYLLDVLGVMLATLTLLAVLLYIVIKRLLFLLGITTPNKVLSEKKIK